jgi:dolichyl-phosphate beta-glucosyltransferase
MSDAPTISLIIPAYNEAHRLPGYLEAARNYFREMQLDYELIVVDDGSRDGLDELLSQMSPGWPELITLRHEHNQGKGAAVRTGVLAAAGERLLFADADGATPICQEDRLREALERGADLAIGSRYVSAPGVARRRRWTRAILSRLFALVVRFVLRLPVRDTQCGFKMFRREVGHALFAELTECRFLFDLEILVLAQARGHRIAEIPIPWNDQPGGQLKVRRELARITAGLWRLRQRQINLRAGLEEPTPPASGCPVRRRM